MNVILLSDFNIHVDTDRSNTTELMNVSECFNLTQHVNFSSHTHGHILDLVCPSGLNDVSTTGTQIGISDHKLIEFSLNFPRCKSYKKNVVSYHNLKAVDLSSFSTSVCTRLLSDSLKLSCSSNILSNYNSAISDALEEYSLIFSLITLVYSWTADNEKRVFFSGQHWTLHIQCTFPLLFNKQVVDLEANFATVNKLIHPPAQDLYSSDELLSR